MLLMLSLFPHTFKVYMKKDHIDLLWTYKTSLYTFFCSFVSAYSVNFVFNSAQCVEVWGAYWPQISSNKSAPKHLPHSIHGCPCGMSSKRELRGCILVVCICQLLQSWAECPFHIPFRTKCDIKIYSVFPPELTLCLIRILKLCSMESHVLVVYCVYLLFSEFTLPCK